MRIFTPYTPVGPALFRSGVAFEGCRGRSEAPRRQLSSRAVRRGLPAPPEVESDVLVQVLVDLSGSMIGGHDATGLRFEATLIALEHLGLRRLTKRRRGRYHVQILSFDLDSPLDLEPVEISLRHLSRIEAALLAPFPGGCSSLNASLVAAEATQHDAARRLLVVLSDLELYGDPPDIFDRLATSSADVVLAVVFSSPVPTTLGPPVIVEHVDPSTEAPDLVARHIVTAAQHLAAPRTSGKT